MCDFCRGEKINTSNGAVMCASIVPFPGINLTNGEVYEPEAPYHALIWECEEQDELKIKYCPMCGELLHPAYAKQNEYITKLKQMREEFV